MNRTQALERARRVAQVSGMSTDRVEAFVGQVDRLLVDVGEDVQARTVEGAPWSVPDGHEPLDYLLAHLLEQVPSHAYRTAQAWALRFTALPHRRGQHLVGHPVPAADAKSLEEHLGMSEKRPMPRAPRTLEEQLGMSRPPQREQDELSRRLGDFS